MKMKLSNQGFQYLFYFLIFFPINFLNGQNNFFRAWGTGTGTQFIKELNSLNDWSTWNNIYFSQGVRVQDFEYYNSTASSLRTHTSNIPINGIQTSEFTNCDDLVSCFMEDYSIPGATFAIAKDGKLAYMRSFGYADLAQTEETQPHHLFRIASLSKPITSIAIMKLVENGQLSLNEKVFGSGKLLPDSYFLNAISDTRIYDITVQHLLEHSSGWNRDVTCTPDPTSPYPYNITSCDPIGFPLHVTQVLGENNLMTERAAIKFLLQKGLNFNPGNGYAYSNIGYLVLGEIIERITGLEYEDYVKSALLEPIGICNMHMARNLQLNKLEREGEYMGNGGTGLSSYGNNILVPWEYGGLNIEAMDAHGGWIATASDLVKLLVSVDGFNTKPDILSRTSISTMTTPSKNNNGYAKGWAVNTANNWWHTGSLSGTSSLFVRTANGYTWAIILNKRIIGIQENQFWSDFDVLPWDCIAKTDSYPVHDLMLTPTQSASNLSFSNANATSMNLSWNSGNGNKRLIVVKEGTPVDRFPIDGSTYTSSNTFGRGSNLGNGNYVIYNNRGNRVSLSNLSPNSTYHFRVFEYNENSSTGNYSLYRLCDSPSFLQATSK